MTEGTRHHIAYVADTMVGIQLLEGLADHFDVTLVSPAALGDDATNFWPPAAGHPIDRVQLPGGRIGFPIRAARWLRAHRHDIDVAVGLDNLVAALGANLGRLGGGPPAVLKIGRPTLEYIRCQRADRSALSTWGRLATARFLIAVNERLATGIGAVSEYVAGQCRRRNRNVRAIGWQGVDTDRFASSCSKEEARRQLGLPPEGPVVMWRSRFAPEKDPRTFLEAVARLRADGRDVCAVYMGGEIPEMEALARSLDVGVVARSPATPDEIPLWYVAADVDVQTSQAEGLGVSVLESLACGTPVVVSATGGLPETVDGGRCGRIVTPGDVDATATAIAEYLDDPGLAARHVAAGRRHVQQRYERTSTFEAWAELIHDAAELASSRRAVRSR